MFVAGQKVICINSNPNEICSAMNITAGDIYVVSHYSPISHDNLRDLEIDTASVILTDTSWNPNDPKAGYLASRFKALNDPAIEIFKKMCENTNITF